MRRLIGFSINNSSLAFFLRFGYIYYTNLGARLAGGLPKLGLSRNSEEPGVEHPPQSLLTAEIDRLLSLSIRQNITEDVSPALFLSGGIDSPLIAAIAQSLSLKPLKAFTFSSQDEATDEAGQAAAYAEEIGLEHHIVTLDPDELPEIIVELISRCDEPPGDYSIIPTILVCREAKKYSDVILSGDGADELFWGYASRMSRVIRLAPLFRLPKFLRKLRWWILRRPYEWNPRYFDTIGEWYRSGHEHNFETQLKQIFPTLPSLSENLSLYNFAGTTQSETAYWTRWNEFNGHMQAGLTKVRLASKAANIRVESPFLDAEMIEFASGLDWRSCLDIENEVGKIPLRSLLAKYVRKPSMSKLGFGVPMGSWLRGPLRGMFETKVLRRESLMGLEIRKDVMAAAFEAHLNGNRDSGWGLWIFLSLAIWEDTHQRVIVEK